MLTDFANLPNSPWTPYALGLILFSYSLLCAVYHLVYYFTAEEDSSVIWSGLIYVVLTLALAAALHYGWMQKASSWWIAGLLACVILHSTFLWASRAKTMRLARQQAERLLVMHRFREDYMLNASREITVIMRRLTTLTDSKDVAKLSIESRKLEEFILNMFDYLRIGVRETASASSRISSNKDATSLRLQELQDELNRIEKLRRDLFSSISHDLRTPLTSIQGYVDAILNGLVESPEQQREYLKRVQIRIQGLIKLIEELSMSMQFETKQVSLTLEPVAPQDMVLAEIERYSLDVTSAGIALYAAVSPELIASNCRVSVDIHKLDRVYANLVGNAIRYTPSGGSITLGADLSNKHVVFTVKDTGKGIDKTDLPRVFERFYMGEKSRSSLTGSSGLGLSIAKEIIEAHGGSIWIESELNKGTVVFFKLPLV